MMGRKRININISLNVKAVTRTFSDNGNCTMQVVAKRVSASGIFRISGDYLTNVCETSCSLANVSIYY